MYIIYFIRIILLNICNGTLHSDDFIIKYDAVDNAKSQIYDGNRYSNMLEGFDNYLFGFAYADRNEDIRAGFLKHGII